MYDPLSNDMFEQTKNSVDIKPVLESICVDASCKGNPGVMEYRVVNYKTKEIIFNSRVFKKGTNIIGEFLAIVHGLWWLKKNNLDWIVYSDCFAAIQWVKNKRVNTGLEPAPDTQETLSAMVKALNMINIDGLDTSKVVKWETDVWGEIPADFGRK